MTEPKIKIWTARSLAELVQTMRESQRKNGAGYLSASGMQVTRPAEAAVDAAVQTILSRPID